MSLTNSNNIILNSVYLNQIYEMIIKTHIDPFNYKKEEKEVFQ